MKIKYFNVLLLVFSLLVFVYAFFIYDNDKPLRYLPIYGERESHSGDTVYHTIPAFSFIDQNGNTVSDTNFKGSVYVTDFFFTTCGSICPVMSTQMERVTKAFNGNNEVKFLSHTVDPETDSVKQLKAYAIEHHANDKQWMFVTGSKKELYDIARKGYLLDAHQGDGSEDDFIHTQNFALIDKDKRIRGFYDGTSTKEVDQLIKDVELLLAEYHYKEKNK